MDYKNIKQTLDRYFEGETSLQEEAELRRYFNEAEIDPKLKVYQPLFQFFAQEQEQMPGQNFEENLLRKINLEEKPQAGIRRFIPMLSRVAAAVTLVLGMWWAYTQYATPEPPKQQAIDWSQFEPETPQEALQITRAALQTASSKLNNGTVKAMMEFNKIDKVGKIFK